jgi:hypothetical protein
MPARAVGGEPGGEVPSFGFASTSAKSARPRPAASRMSSARVVIAMDASPRSVTRSGRAIPACAQAAASSAMRPGPNLIAVG